MAVVFDVVSVDSATFLVHPSRIPVVLFRLAARPPVRPDLELYVAKPREHWYCWNKSQLGWNGPATVSRAPGRRISAASKAKVVARNSPRTAHAPKLMSDICHPSFPNSRYFICPDQR